MKNPHKKEREMTRRALVSILALYLLAGTHVTTPAQTSLRVSADSSVKVVGGTFWIHVNIANVNRLAGFSVTIGLDGAAVQYLSGVDDGFLPTGVPFGLLVTPHPDAGLTDSVTFDKVNFMAPASGSGRLFSARLRAVTEGTTTVRIGLVKLRDAANNPLPAELIYCDSLVVYLPVRYSSFTASWTAGKGVQLNWRTATELGNYGFEVQRSANPGSGFITVPGAFLPAAGTSSGERSYAYLDRTVAPGIWYYRLRQIGVDSSSSFNDPLQVQVLTSAGEAGAPLSYGLFQNYPNPFNPSTTISFSLPRRLYVTLTVFNPLGQEVAELLNGEVDAGFHEARFNAAHLVSGVYFYRLSAGGFTDVRTMLVVK